MGKPFNKELDQLMDTVFWAAHLQIENIQKVINCYNAPVYIVGSGGSLSACYFAANLFTAKGIFAKAITPLELFYSKATFRNANFIFISASGKNTDILFGFKVAVKSEPLSILSICMKENTKIGILSKMYSGCTTIEFNCPSKKDGFLATNSLIAYYVILYRSILKKSLNLDYKINEPVISNFIKELKKDTTICILYSGLTQSVAIDLESKFTEAGLGHILLADYRNFAHGRHNWFDKKKNSAIVALVTNSDHLLCDHTLNLLPKEIPKFKLVSKLDNYETAIELLLQSFYIVKAIGEKEKIDPGKPGVPEYGSKIYNLRYEKLLVSNENTYKITPIEEMALLRKVKTFSLNECTSTEIKMWRNAYSAFIKKISEAKFGGIILDYDGTICSSKNRLIGLTSELAFFIIEYLKKGFVLGIVSGRGKSMRADLNKIFKKDTEYLKRNIVLGYYNGSDIASLDEEEKPDKTKPLHESLSVIKRRLEELNITAEESPNQLSFGSNGENSWQTLKGRLCNEIMLLNLPDIQMVESSHSIDIIPRKEGSKNNIITFCKHRCKELNIKQDFLFIGDKGQWPGNDYELLSNSYSLSVDEVSADFETCWNICPAGIKNVEGISYLFNNIKFNKDYFTLEGL